MALDPRFVTSKDLENLLVDKDTGAFLANGLVYFYKDLARTTLKPIYQLTGAPPNYTYTQLPNPITISAIGTFMDNNGDNIALYYFPWDSMDEGANLELYYVAVFNQFGVPQFTREAWPNYFGEQGGGPNGPVTVVNLIENPQFGFINFVPGTPLTISSGGAGTVNTNIAPGWVLRVNFSGAGSLTVAQTPVAGASQYPTNPPYTLDITPGLNIISIALIQQLNHTPDIWSPATAGTNGYVATNIVLGPATQAIVTYAPSVATAGNPQTILSASNLTGSYKEFTNTVQLLPAANTDTSTTGFVNIVISLSPTNFSSVTSVQVLGLETNVQNIAYQQTPLWWQQSTIINIIIPQLAYKPIPSYLVGWDFPLNPTQPLGPTITAFASGANTSNYFWDQTVIFQSANSGVAASRGTNGCLTCTATNTTQLALIQYLEQDVARMILNDRNSVNVAATSNKAGGLQATISLWYTTDANLPSAGAGNSLVATISAAGKPATFHGNWTEVPRSGLGDATFTIGASPTTTNFNDYGFSGWDLKGIAATNTATFFAIVVGTASLPATNVVNFDSISLVPGDIPTRPAPETGGVAQFRCQKYYEMSFDFGIIPATGIHTSSGMIGYSATSVNGALAQTIVFRNAKTYLPTVTFYNPVSNNNQARNLTDSIDCTNTMVYLSGAANGLSKTGFIPDITAGGGGLGAAIVFHYTADARLGV